MDIEALPGGDFIREGLQDLAAGRESAAALLVAVGAPRLRRAGLQIPSLPFDRAEHRLYELLPREHADAERIRAFVDAVERAAKREMSSRPPIKATSSG